MGGGLGPNLTGNLKGDISDILTVSIPLPIRKSCYVFGLCDCEKIVFGKMLQTHKLNWKDLNNQS